MHGQTNIKIIFLDKFSKNTQILNFLKISSHGAAFYADRWTDIHDKAVTFFNFANATENWSVSFIHNSRLSPNSLRESYEEQSHTGAKSACWVTSGKVILS